MKIAVCLQGQPRFFEQGIPLLKKSFEGLDVDYFIHNWYHEEHIGEEQVPTSSPNIHKRGWTVAPNADKNLINLLSPKKYIFEKQKVFVPKYDFDLSYRNGPAEVYISQLYSRKRVGELLSEYVEQTGEKYDWVFFTRTDFALLRNIVDELAGPGSDEIILTAHAPGEVWNKDHINDPFVGSNYKNMIYWSSLYDHYEQYWISGVPFCGHRLPSHHMNLLRIPYRQILSPQGEGWAYIRANGLSTC